MISIGGTIFFFTITCLEGTYFRKTAKLWYTQALCWSQSLTFSCHPHHLHTSLPLAYPSSKNRHLTTFHPTVPAGRGCAHWHVTWGRWLTPLRGSSCPQVICPDEAVTSHQLLHPPLCFPQRQAEKCWSQRLCLNCLLRKSHGLPGASGDYIWGRMHVLPLQETECSRWPISQKGASLASARTATKKQLCWKPLPTSRGA